MESRGRHHHPAQGAGQPRGHSSRAHGPADICCPNGRRSRRNLHWRHPSASRSCPHGGPRRLGRQRAPGVAGAPSLALREPLLRGTSGEGQAHRSHAYDLRRTGHHHSARLHQPGPAALPVDENLPGAQSEGAHQRETGTYYQFLPRAGAGRAGHAEPGGRRRPGLGHGLWRICCRTDTRDRHPEPLGYLLLSRARVRGLPGRHEGHRGVGAGRDRWRRNEPQLVCRQRPVSLLPREDRLPGRLRRQEDTQPQRGAVGLAHRHGRRTPVRRFRRGLR